MSIYEILDILEISGYLETVSPRGLVRLTSYQRGLSEGDLPGQSALFISLNSGGFLKSSKRGNLSK